MSLFRTVSHSVRDNRPKEPESDEDLSEIEDMFDSGKKRKARAGQRSAAQPLSSSAIETKKAPKVIIIDTDDETDIHGKQGNSKRMKPSSGTEDLEEAPRSAQHSVPAQKKSTGIIDLDLGDEETPTILEFKKSISSAREERAAELDELLQKSITPETPLNSTRFVIPVVKSAKERAEEAAQLLAKKSNSLTSSSSRLTETAPAAGEGLEYQGKKIQLKTRLGSHEHTWHIVVTAPFSQFRKKLAAFYDVSPEKILLSFDGESLKDGDTAESRELEEDDLLDVKMDKTLIAAAIEFAKSKS